MHGFQPSPTSSMPSKPCTTRPTSDRLLLGLPRLKSCLRSASVQLDGRQPSAWAHALRRSRSGACGPARLSALLSPLLSPRVSPLRSERAASDAAPASLASPKPSGGLSGSGSPRWCARNRSYARLVGAGVRVRVMVRVKVRASVRVRVRLRVRVRFRSPAQRGARERGLVRHGAEPGPPAQRGRRAGEPEERQVGLAQLVLAQEGEVRARGLRPRRLDQLRRLRVVKVEEARDRVRQLAHVVLRVKPHLIRERALVQRGGERLAERAVGAGAVDAQSCRVRRRAQHPGVLRRQQDAAVAHCVPILRVDDRRRPPGAEGLAPTISGARLPRLLVMLRPIEAVDREADLTEFVRRLAMVDELAQRIDREPGPPRGLVSARDDRRLPARLGDARSQRPA